MPVSFWHLDLSHDSWSENTFLFPDAPWPIREGHGSLCAEEGLLSATADPCRCRDSRRSRSSDTEV
ncbi:hypothetical protein I7I50_02222 [Histoplasma capsulatum G186AR]|uniref:Uncharacterized protein n=1 Tax=Ajellomyces capsulatus TaxID=5037 RepID=A0A8H8CT60_AJECA|nr:hypothetical protein I7I52_12436 [Histoplasma capsulatum]QSS71404.1 hypothetical protein I7I50_02222 [Histoplasma capsulatum G186AR]